MTRHSCFGTFEQTSSEQFSSLTGIVRHFLFGIFEHSDFGREEQTYWNGFRFLYCFIVYLLPFLVDRYTLLWECLYIAGEAPGVESYIPPDTPLLECRDKLSEVLGHSSV